VIELEVVGITTRPISEEERQRLRDQAVPFPGEPPPAPGAVVVDAPAPDGPRWKHEVRLKERDGDRVLDIAIGDAEALAIQLGLRGILTPRPMTHDFFGNLLHALDDVAVHRLLITKRERGTFHARLEVQHRDRLLDVDCRPSDGVALAIRLGVPIVAADEMEPVLAAA
jgi:bifunctional DNase/RNase